jgi:DUF4097 and DUF4098 domain-containing protein YvlB
MVNPWKLWKIHGKSSNYGKSRGKSMGNYEKLMENPWEIHANYGKLMENPWKKTRIDGKIYGTSINHHKSWETNHQSKTTWLTSCSGISS